MMESFFVTRRTRWARRRNKEHVTSFAYFVTFVLKFLGSAITTLAITSSPHIIAEETPKIDTISIDIEANFKPALGLGLILTSKGTIQRAAKDIRELRAGHYVLSFLFRSDNLPKDAMATALLTSEKGEISFGNVRPVFSPSSDDSLFALPECPREKVSVESVESETALLKSLVDIRSARRGYAQTKVSRLMDVSFVEKLRKLESGFGLSHPEELSPDLNPSDLIDRLSRLVQAIRNVRSAKERAESESNESSKP